MSDNKHTPGPWAYRPLEFDDWGIVRAGDYVVAQARAGGGDVSLDEHRANKTDPYEANARLIAAAPDLLEALKEYVRDFGGNEDADSRRMVEKANAAIAKAGAAE